MSTIKTPVGYSSDGLIKVYSINYDIDDTITFQFMNDPIQTEVIDYSGDESPTFKCGEMVYSMSEIMKAGQ